MNRLLDMKTPSSQNKTPSSRGLAAGSSQDHRPGRHFWIPRTSHRTTIVAFITLLFAACIYALPEDDHQIMHIIANSSLFNYKSGFNVYEGDVKINQGETHLTADRVTTQSNSHHKIEEAIAYGNKQLAHYWTLPRKGDVLFHAQANIITFYPQKSLVRLVGNVSVTQGNNSFNGQEIIYNIKDQTVSAPPTSKGRATIVIDPNKVNS